mmetsp:Transcript_15431/g.25700  ORF Transcript_15431/g.25700 Transcript_15431/m.25700 type:complete len:85 (+) Transcript_15431:188-442(+)
MMELFCGDFTPATETVTFCNNPVTSSLVPAPIADAPVRAAPITTRNDAGLLLPPLLIYLAVPNILTAEGHSNQRCRNEANQVGD